MENVENQDSQEVVLETEGALALIRLGAVEERAVVLTQKRMQSLSEKLAVVRANRDIKGLIIVGSSPSMFCAGADINAIQTIVEAPEAQELASLGQKVFAEIASLPQVTVAAVSGACVGGGCELALSCDYRVAANLPATRIGLPEIKLGILPGFGGTQRLPRLIGLPAALDIILKGRVVDAKKAQKIGLADFLVEPKEEAEDTFEALIAKACEFASGQSSLNKHSIKFFDKMLTHTSLGRSIVLKKVKAQLAKTTKGHYPAPTRALEVCLAGLAKGPEVGFAEEAKALGELLVSPESKSLVHLYFLTENATRNWKSVNLGRDGVKVGVLGAGTMGSGIAASFLMSGNSVVLVDLALDARKKALARIKKSLSKRHQGVLENLDSVLKFDESVEAFADVEVAIEAILEDLELKKKVFKQLEDVLGPQAVIASNTSSLSVSECAAHLSSSNRVLGMHFFNPTEKMPLVEIIRAKQTDDRTVAFTAALVVALGKYPVVVEEVPGFLINRLLSPYLVEAAYTLKDGVRIEDIDRAAESFGMPMGPLRLLDEVGLDVASHVATIMEDAYGARMGGPKFAGKLAEGGLLGCKSSKGFYVHQGREAEPNSEIYALLEIAQKDALKKSEYADTADRLVLPMLNEAIRCLDEGVAGVPGRDAAEQIDLATVMGIGFAPFRGGIIHYAETVGAKSVLKRLKALQKRFGKRFAPCDGVIERAKNGVSFYEAL